MDMVTESYRYDIPELVQEGAIPEEVVDEAVRRILRIKFMLGLFDHPFRTTPEKEGRSMLLPEHLKLAREMARRSIVLLKNENKTLPLKKDGRKIAVIGPLADNAEDMLGSWAFTGSAKDVVTILAGIRSAAGDGAQVFYARGCDIDGKEEIDFSEALEAAGKADVVVAVVGESNMMSGEAASRLELNLPGHQEALLKTLHELGKPLVVVLSNGRPLAIPWADQHASAILETWQLGVQAGNAVADVLFGDYNPSGKLAATFPYAVGQCPIYYNRPMTGRPAGAFKFTSKYIDGPTDPLYPFGFGLSYTTFDYTGLEVSPAAVSVAGRITVQATVTNSGEVTGEEVVQLYVGDVVASRVRPVKELKGFHKVALQPGESRRIKFEVEAIDLGFYDEGMSYVVEPGLFKVWLGPNSRDGLEGEFKIED
jgi:beta-glucosidase